MNKLTKIAAHRSFIPSLIFIYVLLLAGGLALQHQKIGIITLAIAVIPLFAFLVLFRFQLLGLLTAFIIPLSIPTQIGSGAVVSVPGEIMVLLLSFFYIVFSLNKDDGIDVRIWRHPITILIFIDLGWSIFTALIGEMPLVSLKRVLIKGMFIVVFYFFFTDLFRKKENLWRVWLLYGVGLIIPVFWTLYNHANHDFSQVVSFVMPLPFFNDHTLYSTCLAFVLPVFILLSFKPSWFGLHKNYRFVFILTVALFLVGEYFSFSRAAWLSIILSFVAGLLIIYLRFKAFHFFILVLISATVLSFFTNDIYQNVRTVSDVSRKDDVEQHFRSVMNIQTDDSNLERINRWQCAIRMFQDQPTTGFGPGTYQFVYGKYQISTELTRISTNHGEKGNAHSEYLMYLSEMGWPGLLIFLFLVYTMISRAIKVFHSSTNKSLRWLTFAILMGLMSFLIHGLFNSFIDTDKVAILFYGAAALVVSIELYYTGDNKSSLPDTNPGK